MLSMKTKRKGTNKKKHYSNLEIHYKHIKSHQLSQMQSGMNRKVI